MNEHIVVVEDEEDIQELFAHVLKQEGFRVTLSASGEEALRLLERHPPDLLLLDLMLPGIDGLGVCRRMKEQPATRHVPIIMVTAKGEESDIVTGLELGADDYLPKPFSPRVLVARIRSVLRRRAGPAADAESPLERGPLYIYPGRREVRLDGAALQLTYSEFELLHFLARRPGWVFTRNQIVEAVHGQDYHVTDRSVDVQIVGLRKKLGPHGRMIETIRGVGYRFND
ncbi:MAG: response regulator transcription factor [Candidatus Lambdaproteobacteria bacterium]|nr:response regulator transcription factor [Candidatus Lambdaproteobacteria bacterium]